MNNKWLRQLDHRNLNLISELKLGRDSSVGIATRYGLHVPGIESRWGGEIFRNRADRPWGPPSLLYNGHRISFPGVKRPEWGVDHLPQTSAEVKKRVEIYLNFFSGPSWSVLGWTLPFTFRVCLTGGVLFGVLRYACVRRNTCSWERLKIFELKKYKHGDSTKPSIGSRENLLQFVSESVCNIRRLSNYTNRMYTHYLLHIYTTLHVSVYLTSSSGKT